MVLIISLHKLEYINLWSYFYIHFIDEETDDWMSMSNLKKGTQMVNGAIWIWTQAVWHLSQT